MKKVKTKPEEYLDALPVESREDMKKLHGEISRVMKGLPVTVWEGRMWGGSEQAILGYGDMRYGGSRGKTVDWFYIGLALQKNYISLYVNAVADNQYLGQKYARELGKVKVGSASISFKRLADIDIGKLRELLNRARQLMPPPPAS